MPESEPLADRLSTRMRLHRGVGGRPPGLAVGDGETDSPWKAVVDRKGRKSRLERLKSMVSSGPTAAADPTLEADRRSIEPSPDRDSWPPHTIPWIASARRSESASGNTAHDPGSRAGRPTSLRPFPVARPSATTQPRLESVRSFPKRVVDTAMSYVTAPGSSVSPRELGVAPSVAALPAPIARASMSEAGHHAAPREGPPPVTRAAVERRYGVDLSSVPVHRGPASGARARDLGAGAFTERGAVHIPAEAGPLDTGFGKRLLVHELVHVAQQRRLAPDVPAEASSLGRTLEAEAQAMEAATVPALESGRRHVEPEGRLGVESPPLVAPPGLQRAAEPLESQRDPVAMEPSIDEIVTRLYDRVSSRLKAELLIDRERAGLLNNLR